MTSRSGMACQKVCKQCRDHIKVNCKYTKPRPCMFLTLKCKRSGDKTLFTYLHIYAHEAAHTYTQTHISIASKNHSKTIHVQLQLSQLFHKSYTVRNHVES